MTTNRSVNQSVNLSVNLNKVALVRNSRDGATPSVVHAAELVIAAGAAGVTVHPRPDQRHIRPHDVFDLAELLKQHPAVEYNIEGNPLAGTRDNGYPGFDALVAGTRPHQVTLVPDSDDQLTSDHGWVLDDQVDRVAELVARYQALGARVSLFMDPDDAQIRLAQRTGADRIELYTGPFADTFATAGADAAATRESFDQFADAARFAAQLGLGVNAGHDLDLANLQLFRQIPELLEVSIGHALASEALLHRGLSETVSAYLKVLAG